MQIPHQLHPATYHVWKSWLPAEILCKNLFQICNDDLLVTSSYYARVTINRIRDLWLRVK